MPLGFPRRFRGPGRHVSGRAGAAGDRPYAGDQLPYAEGLGEVVVCAEFQAHDPIGFLAPRGDHDDGDGGASAQAAADVQPVHIGQAQIQQHQIRRHFGVGQAGGSGADMVHGEPLAPQPLGEGAGDPVVVFDEQQPHGARLAQLCQRRWRVHGKPPGTRETEA